nr:hypothetical protein [Tanacetum cinerariifolium]
LDRDDLNQLWDLVKEYLSIRPASSDKEMELRVELKRDDLNQLWDLVKEYLSIRPASSDKEMELRVELKRLYEPDPEDQLDSQRQRDLHASSEGLSSEEGSSPCNDLLQASSGELFTDGK